MDATTAFLIAYLATLAAIAVIWIDDHITERRYDEQTSRESTEEAFASLVDKLSTSHAEHTASMQRHLEALMAPPPSSPATTPTTGDYPGDLFGQVATELDRHNATVTAVPPDPMDYPDWTDTLLPDGRGDQPRVATIRPGDSPVPGGERWEEMLAEGREVVGGEMHGGDEQWGPQG